MMATARHHYDAAWHVDAVLADGTRVTLRLVRPEDKRLLRDGFHRLSAASRYLRFFAAKRELTDAELAHLTELDGVNTLAVGAVRQSADGTLEGLGVARFARDPAVFSVAEAAVAVVDAVQGKGLGTLLLLHLAAAARERGIGAFSGEFLAANAAVRQLIEDTCPDARLTTHGDVIRAEVPLPDPDIPAGQTPAGRLMRQVAGGRLAFRLPALLPSRPEDSL
jgi:GNAT superfamily N-acetyltransferase